MENMKDIELTKIEKVRVTHLSDNDGHIQMVFPESHMLDIAAVSRITKRRLEPIAYSHREGSTLLKPNSIFTLLEANMLKEQVTYAIRSPSKDDGQHYSTRDLETLFAGPLSRFEDISIPQSSIASPVDNHEEDETQILTALGRFQSIRIKKRLEETLEIPPLPASSQRIIKLSSDPSTGTGELCDVISLDPILAAQVVSWASSPYYGAPGSIDSVEDAIIRVLGFDMVMNLALGLSMKTTFNENKGDSPRHYQDYWLDSVTNAVLVEALVKVIPNAKRPKLGHAYLAGLLQNFGFLALGTIFPPHFSILSRYQEANAHMPDELIEMHILHFTREQLGSWLLRYWSLPDNIWTAIRYSKKPHYYGEHAILAKLLYIAHQLRHDAWIEPSVLTEVGLTLEQAEECLQRVFSSSAELHQIASLINKV